MVKFVVLQKLKTARDAPTNNWRNGLVRNQNSIHRLKRDKSALCSRSEKYED